MTIKYIGKITYKDTENIEFEIDEENRIKFKFNGEFQWEGQEHLSQITNTIVSAKILLSSNSPVKFEMEEKI